MTKNIRDIDRYTSEDTTRMQAMWTGIVLAAVILVASFLYFTGKTAEEVAQTRDAVTMPHTTGTTGTGAPAR